MGKFSPFFEAYSRMAAGSSRLSDMPMNRYRPEEDAESILILSRFCSHQWHETEKTYKTVVLGPSKETEAGEPSSDLTSNGGKGVPGFRFRPCAASSAAFFRAATL